MPAPRPARRQDEIVAARSQDEIVDAALEVINPPANQRAAIRAEWYRCFKAMRNAQAHWPMSPSSQRESTKQLQRYLELLRAVKETHCPWWDEEDAEFRALLHARIERGERHLRPGARPRDSVAGAAVVLASDYLTPAQRTVTRDGKWHRLSALLYEGATGRTDTDKVLKYMSEMKHGKTLRRPLLD